VTSNEIFAPQKEARSRMGLGDIRQASLAGRHTTCLHTDFIKAAERGDIKLLRKILGENCKAAIAFRNERGWSACHLAALEGHAAVLELLYKVDREALDLPAPDTGQTPCHFAARWAKNHKNKTMPVLLWIWRNEPRLFEVEDKKGKTSIKMVADNLFAGSQSDARRWLSEQTGTAFPPPSYASISNAEVATPPAVVIPGGRASSGSGGPIDISEITVASAPGTIKRNTNAETGRSLDVEWEACNLRWKVDGLSRQPDEGLSGDRTWDQHDTGSAPGSNSPWSGDIPTASEPDTSQNDANDCLEANVSSQRQSAAYSLPGNQLKTRREYIVPHSHTDISETWKKEYKVIRSSLEYVFGSAASVAMLTAWGVDETIPKLLTVDPDPTQGGKPVGYEKIGRGQKHIDELITVSKEGNDDDVEHAFSQIPPDCAWVHLPVYKCLALAGSRDDGEEVREILVSYAENMIESKLWDPAVLLSASRAAQVQGWPSSTRHILLALYQALFPKQSMAFMSTGDHLFWENSGISESENGQVKSALLSEKVVESKKQGVEDQWTLLKREFKIQSASMDDLMKLTGLQQVKLEALKTVQKLLLDQQFKKQQRVVTTCNFAFMGNPGTGVFKRCERVHAEGCLTVVLLFITP
jgi:hypothetical protein